MEEVAKLKRVVIKEELYTLTGDTIEAIILGQLIYWQNKVKDFDYFINEEIKRCENNGIEINIECLNGWIYKKASELSDECMLNVSEVTMRRYLQKLIDKKYICGRTNPKYKWDRTMQYRVNLKYIITKIKELGYDGLAGYTLLHSKNEATELQNEVSEENNEAAIPDTTYIDYSKEDNNKKEQGWKTDFNAYYQLVVEAQNKLLLDNEFRERYAEFNQNVDYELTLKKMIVNYWGTEIGWKKKKSSRSESINMLSTLKKAFENPLNKVYKQRQFGKYNEPAKSNAPMPNNYTRVPLHKELKFINDEGALSDGTFVKDGYRYYFSKRDSKSYSIPPATEPKPIGDGYEYDGNYDWFLNE